MEYPIIQLQSSGFPELISEIPEPPTQIFVRGTLPTTEKMLAVVGSRKCSAYGRAACEKIIAGLAGHSVTIVSGLALGIDAIAHRAALLANLPCLAVPGSWLEWDALYPSTNRSLAQAILAKGGALLSEFDPSQRAAQWTFPKRNRVMVGLSHAVLLIEAEERSGTLITARLAAEYNRDLLGVPGSIFSASSVGVHQFLKLGARMVTSATDVLDTLGLKADEQQAEMIDMSDLTPEEQRVFTAARTATSREELVAASGLSAHDASIALSLLEIKGLIRERMGQIEITANAV